MRASHIHYRIDQQNVYYDFIISVQSQVLNLEEEYLSQQGVSTWIQEIRDQWQQFSTAHTAINLAMSKVDSVEKKRLWKRSYFKKDIFKKARDSYLDTIMKLSALSDKFAEKISSRSHSPPQSSLMSASFRCARLPRLELTKFDGTLSKWLSFKGIFTSFVINELSIPPEIKLQYLKNCLTGSAAEILVNTEIVGENFHPSWEAIVSRYENPRLLVHSSLLALFSTKKMTKECGNELEKLYNSITQEIRTLRMLKEPVDHWDSVFVFMTVQRLDSETVKAWEQELGACKESPSWSRLKSFLETRIQTLKAFAHSQPGKPSIPLRPHSARVHFTGHKTENHFKDKMKCVLCNGEHYISRCPKYQNMTTVQRRDCIKNYRLCYNCLGFHPVAKCQSSTRCLKCAKPHHTTIHLLGPSRQKENSITNESPVTAVTTNDLSKQVNHASFPSVLKKTVFLPTAIVNVTNNHGDHLVARALLDQGSEISLVTENLIQRLKVPRQPGSLSLNMVNNKTSKSRGLSVLRIKPCFQSSFELTVNALILPKLTETIPSDYVNKDHWPQFENLLLADPTYNKPGPIDIIIGSDLYGYLLKGPIIKGPNDSPVAQLTSLGWVISGPSATGKSSIQSNTFHYSVDEDLHKLLERFWLQEEISPTSQKPLSTEDQECEDHFESTHKRDANGKYIVKLPFNSHKGQLGDSTASALKMLQCLQRKFNSDNNFQQAYADFLREYAQLGHMIEIVDTTKDTSPRFYLPHHGVIRDTSSTTKLRVVFNGSCKTTNGIPLNQTLHTGSKLQNDLFDVLLWFRKFKYVFSSDIEKMYRQIMIHEDDWNYQRIFWRDQNQIKQFQLTTVTYGLACAPFLALRTIIQLIEDERSNFPLAVDTLKHGRYVDDIFGGADTLDEAQQVAKQVNQMCMAGGFPLKKWVANHESVLHFIPLEYVLPVPTLKLNDNIIHILGLLWNSTSDWFCFDVPSNFLLSTRVTKRAILSKVAQFFDPLGLLSPIFIRFKIFLQELWVIKLSWDESLDKPQQDTWQQLLQSLHGINTLKIPRWIHTTQESSIEIHGFCDASQSAMAAAVYIRVQSSSQHTTSLLLCSKTKVAPLKRMTIPRLELSSAVMLTKLVVHCLKTLKINKAPYYLWTDSSIVYTWLNEHPSKWKEFVHNRVCFIQETLPNAHWKHVPGKFNPADCATRGLSTIELQDYDPWWRGPSWLIEDSANWPSQLSSRTENPETLEFRNHKVQTTQIIHDELLNRYSSLTKLIRITATCKRALQCFKRTGYSLSSNPLTPEELEDAACLWIKHVQLTHFGDEIRHITSNQELPKSTTMIRLMPFIDKRGLLRVGGRLRNSTLPQTSKHPYILPKFSPLTTLLIQDAHHRTFHGSTQDTLSYLRNKYWIIGGRSPVRSFILKCVKCTRFRRAHAKHLMGQLPTNRVTPARAFLHTGVDYAGPFTLKTWKGRGNKTHKSWVALFVCYTTSAIHLEVVSDYSTDAFVAAYRRFTSRRGICSTISSDCGTNFKGAHKELKRLFASASKELQHLASLIANDGTKWLFNPPAAPHFGGKWEAGVKSMKYHLRRVVGETLLTYEEMSTLLAQIESILNSRPLTPLTNDADDLDVLTPGHFPIGHALNLVPEPNLEHLKTNRLSRWQHLSQMIQSFWTKWIKEYLQRYQAVYKWNTHSTPLAVGCLVIIMDERYPPSKWPLGRVTQVHPGKDGIVRVATIKTSYAIVTRPITKLCILPIELTVFDSSLPTSSKAGGNV